MSRRLAFPLISGRRLVGSPFGTRRGRRRGRGGETAGTRPYLPGDPLATIDWPASARLSAARGVDQFIVREYFDEEAPVVSIVLDQRPSMGLYASPSPWLDKPQAAEIAVRAIVASADDARAAVAVFDGSLDGVASARADQGTDADRAGARRAGRVRGVAECARRRARAAHAPASGGGAGKLRVPDLRLSRLAGRRIADGPPAHVRRRRPCDRAGPHVGAQLPGYPGRSAADRRRRDRRTATRATDSRRDACAWAGQRAALRELVRWFRSAGMDPVTISDTSPESVHRVFLEWAARRSRALRRAR